MGYKYVQEEALKNAETVIEEWIDTASKLGRKIPQPAEELQMQ